MDGSQETCTAGGGTLTLEFTLLSRLLGDPVYEHLARRAVRALWDRRHKNTGLVGQLYTLESNSIVGFTSTDKNVNSPIAPQVQIVG